MGQRCEPSEMSSPTNQVTYLVFIILQVVARGAIAHDIVCRCVCYQEWEEPGPTWTVKSPFMGLMKTVQKVRLCVLCRESGLCGTQCVCLESGSLAVDPRPPVLCFVLVLWCALNPGPPMLGRPPVRWCDLGQFTCSELSFIC